MKKLFDRLFSSSNARSKLPSIWRVVVVVAGNVVIKPVERIAFVTTGNYNICYLSFVFWYLLLFFSFFLSLLLFFFFSTFDFVLLYETMQVYKHRFYLEIYLATPTLRASYAQFSMFIRRTFILFMRSCFPFFH